MTDELLLTELSDILFEFASRTSKGEFLPSVDWAKQILAKVREQPDRETFKVELKPVVVEDEPDAHIVTFSVGVQEFTLDNYFSKEEAEWMADMLGKALGKLALLPTREQQDNLNASAGVMHKAEILKFGRELPHSQGQHTDREEGASISSPEANINEEEIANCFCNFCATMNGSCGDRLNRMTTTNPKSPCETCYKYAALLPSRKEIEKAERERIVIKLENIPWMRKHHNRFIEALKEGDK